MNRQKIVIIDDEEDICHLMKTYFIDLNYEVFLANNLAAGLELVKEVQPDIIFLDNNLPDGLGWEKTKTFREISPKSKINLISAYKFSPPDLTGFENVQIIEKPMSLNLLRQYL